MNIDKGLLLVISGPSGVGKGTVCGALRQQARSLHYSVSATTRAPRPGEVDGINYFFKTRDEFEMMIQHDQLLEWAEYAGNYYGTPREYVEHTIAEGNDIILEIEVQGALQVKQKFPHGIFLFLMSPTFEELKNRIVGRGTESEETILRRMNIAREELMLMEQYDYVVVNDEVIKACDRIRGIIAAEHCKTTRQIERIRHWVGEV